MKKALLLISIFSVACMFFAGDAFASQKKSNSAQKRKARSRPKTVAKSAKTEPVRPQVKEIDEAGLKTILEESTKNNRRLLINFWATWCTPCREEFPDLVEIDKEFAAESDFEFITVSLDEPTEIDKSVAQFLAEMRATSIPAYLVNAKDPENLIALVYPEWRGDLPATFLFGRKGEILFKHTGRVRAEELRAAIKASGAAASGGEK